jgi:phosphoglycerate dehydrogenase-like enzyme
MKTFVIEKMPDFFWHKIKEKGWSKYFTDKPSKDVEIVIIRTNTVADKLFFDRFPNLKLLIRAGTGFDNVDVKAARNLDIQVCNTPEANGLCAFEHTMSFIFALLKQHHIAQENLLQGNWKTGLQNNWEISDLKALIVGVGRVGTRVAKALQYFGAEVKGVDPYLSTLDWNKKVTSSIPYKEGLKWCNLISFHCPLTQETHNYFNDSTLGLLENPIWLINTARGSVVSTSSIQTGIEIGRLLGFAADVFCEEPPNEIELIDFKNVILTPHIGSFTRKAKTRMSVETLAVWSAFVFDGTIINSVENNIFI